jgi:aminocarboxymuconate-semialdehyde decarboxylase
MYPSLKIITHHCGAMVPYFAQRLAGIGETLGRKEYGDEPSVSLSRPPMDYFKMFYADTALSGGTLGLMCGYAFFGVNHILCGTDMPYGGEEQRAAKMIASVEQMAIPDSDKYKIFEGNARRLLRIQ